MGFFSKVVNISASRLGFSFFFLLTSLSLVLFFPELRPLATIYFIMLLLVEAYRAGVQADATPFNKGIILFVVFTIISSVLFLTFKNSLSVDKFFDVPGVSTTGWILYFLLVAHVEEEVFRTILPATMGNYLYPQILYSFFHLLTISYYTESMSMAIMLPYFAFTLAFGIAMMYLTYTFKSNVPAKAVHWTFDLFKKGVLFSVVGVVLS